MKSRAVHFMNKYPGGHVDFTEDRLEAFDSSGQRRVSLRLNGNGTIVSVGHETGAIDKPDMSPIPKNARVHKLFADGSIKRSEEAAEREKVAKEIAVGGKVLSVEEYKDKGYKFDKGGKGETLIGAPDDEVDAATLELEN